MFIKAAQNLRAAFCVIRKILYISFMKKNTFLIIVIFLVIFLLDIDPIYAGPGGTIVKAFFKTWWGKLIMTVLAIIFLPLIIYVQIRESLGIRKSKKQLLLLGKINKDFLPLNLDKTVRNIFSRVYIAWNNEKMNEVSEYVSSWYWQNQQLVHLNQWKKENLKNYCKVEKIGKIKPLYLEISENKDLEGSKIAFRINATIKDYLKNRDTHKIVQGKNEYGEEEKIWILEYTNKKWVLDDIQNGELSLNFAKMTNIIPNSIMVSKSSPIKSS